MLNIDELLPNADWPKRTDDTANFIQPDAPNASPGLLDALGLLFDKETTDVTTMLMPPAFIKDTAKRQAYIKLLKEMGIDPAALGDGAPPDEPKHMPGLHDQLTHGRHRGQVGTYLLHEVQKNGGFTYQPVAKNTPKDGYALSIHQDRERVFDAKELTPDALSAYLEENADLLADKSNYAGGWHDTEAGKVYLDVSFVTHDAGEAQRLCAEHNQEGYFDLGSFETVIVKGETDRRKEAPAKQRFVFTIFDAGSVDAAMKVLT